MQPLLSITSLSEIPSFSIRSSTSWAIRRCKKAGGRSIMTRSLLPAAAHPRVLVYQEVPLFFSRDQIIQSLTQFSTKDRSTCRTDWLLPQKIASGEQQEVLRQS